MNLRNILKFTKGQQRAKGAELPGEKDLASSDFILLERLDEEVPTYNLAGSSIPANSKPTPRRSKG